MKKKIHIIGAGLYGNLLAYLLAKDGHEVTIIDKSNKILSNFDSIKIRSYELNNGFHGIEYPRARELIKFLKKEFEIKFKYELNKRKLIIQDKLINFQQKFETFPDSLKEIYKEKNLEYYKNQKLNYFFKKPFLKKIDKVLNKFSYDHNVSKRFVLPWFLPSNTKIISSDEGMIFRENQRRKKSNSKYFFPKNYLFKNLRKSFLKKYKKLNIRFFLNTQVNYKKNYIEYIKNGLSIKYDYDNTIHFQCSSSIPILAQSNPSKLKELSNFKRFFFNLIYRIERNNYNFFEILCINSKIPFVNRISIAKNLTTKKHMFLQVECISENSQMNKIECKNIEVNLKYYLNLKKINFIGCIDSRTVFYPSNNFVNELKDCYHNFINENNLNLKNRNYIYPINMAKAWLWAKEEHKKIKN